MGSLKTMKLKMSILFMYLNSLIELKIMTK